VVSDGKFISAGYNVCNIPCDKFRQQNKVFLAYLAATPLCYRLQTEITFFDLL
jgi:hypothetical protein